MIDPTPLWDFDDAPKKQATILEEALQVSPGAPTGHPGHTVVSTRRPAVP